MNNPAKNILVLIFYWVYIPRSGIIESESSGDMFSFNRYCQAVFQSDCASLQ